MNYLRLTPAEYGALVHVCHPPNVNRRPLPKLRRFLVGALTDSSPLLADRIHRLGWGELRVIREHFRGTQPPHGVGAEEIEALAEVFGPLVCQARFARCLRRDLREQLQVAAPELGRRLGRLSLAQFEGLCEEVKRRLGRGT